MFRVFPLMLIPVALYNLIVLFGNVIANNDMFHLLTKSFTVDMVSGEWAVSFSDVVLLLAILMLFIEVIKSSGTSRREMINNALSILVFVVALIEFIMLKGFATSAFFFITVLCLFDSIAGPTVTAVAAKRDIGLGSNIIDAG
ncbi:MAG TPA: hypothetical protein VGC27_07025 [Rhizomicrobium sp.]